MIESVANWDAILWAVQQRKLLGKYCHSKRFYLLKQRMNCNSPFKCSKLELHFSWKTRYEQRNATESSRAFAKATKPSVLTEIEQYLIRFSSYLLLPLSCVSAQVFFFDGIFSLHSTSGLVLIPWCLSMPVTPFPYMWSSALFHLPWSPFSALLL